MFKCLQMQSLDKKTQNMIYAVMSNLFKLKAFQDNKNKLNKL